MAEQTVLRFPLGRNVDAEVHPGKALILTIKLDGQGWISGQGTGKSMTKATTGGRIMVPGTEQGRVNVTYDEPLPDAMVAIRDENVRKAAAAEKAGK